MQALKGLVIGLGLTIVLVVGVMVWGLFKKSEDPDFKMFTFSSSESSTSKDAILTSNAAGKPPTPAGIIPSWGTISLNLPAGCTILDAKTDLGRLYIRTGVETAPPIAGCARVTVVDPATGRVLGTVTSGP